jgi:hypothetical protein
VVAAVTLVVLGSTSFLLLALTLLQSTSTGSVNVALLGMDLGRLSPGAAVIVFGTAVALSAGAALLGALLLVRRRAESRGAMSAAEREKLAETELEARARLLEYRLQALSERMADLNERRQEEAGAEPPRVPARPEPRPVPDRRAPERPPQRRRPTKPDLQLVVLPEAVQSEGDAKTVDVPHEAKAASEPRRRGR